MSFPSRRGFLRGSTSVAALSFIGTLQALQARNVDAAIAGDGASGSTGLVASPYGPVAPVLDEATGLPLLQLPEGFAYRSYGWTGDLMRNGQPCPGNHDGMAVIASYGRGSSVDVVLVRNHERGQSTTPIHAPAMYDAVASSVDGRFAGGGTTNLRFKGRQWIGMEPSLGGTLTNCAGGPTPWGTWLSCEETGSNLEPQGGKKHGYVFEVRANAAETTGKPIVAMGRFSHEAVAVDPKTRFAYLTEDSRNKSGFYRFVPADASGRPGSYEAGGRLQMAKVVGRPNADLNVASTGDTHRLEWVDIADPDANPVAIALPGFAGTTAVAGPFAQGWAQGGLRMARGEGIWYHEGKLFIVDTATGVNAAGAGGNGEGAVWEYDLATGLLKAVFVSLDAVAANNPDNITISPRGGVLLCEDGGGVDEGHGRVERLVGLTRDGASFVFARHNVVLGADQIASAGKTVAPGDYRGSEFCGACFDPAGKVLFVNVQSPGITFAIWGPWARGPL
ncbi:PhoX family protein [Variovorax sp. DT-64]|uniref:PhoX family protein n=1 Tax=Variovorax sp. DT-64 TaxID=3396160 RepID=UPI003F1AF3CD